MKRHILLMIITSVIWADASAGTTVQEDGTGDTLLAEPSVETVAADTSRHRFRLLKWVGNYLKNTNKKTDRPFDYSVLIGPSYSASTSAGLGGTVSGLYSWDRADSLLPKSNVSVFANASLTGMLAIGVRGNNFLPHERYRLNYQLYILNFPGKFWGIGYDNGANDSNESDYNRIKVQFKPSFLFRLTSSLYAGVVGDMQWVNAFGFDRPDLLGGQDNSTVSCGLGVNFTYDSRDFVLNAYRGHYFCLEQMFYPSGLGNDYAFSYTDLTYSTYHRVWKGGILALELHTLFNYGDVPWTMLAQVGVQGRMRGYYEGRYRDKNIMEGQLELRQRIKGRHGVALWVGAANVFHNFNNIYYDHTLPNYGIGYRWEFKKRVNVRLDFGFTKDSPNFTFNINEAF